MYNSASITIALGVIGIFLLHHFRRILTVPIVYIAEQHLSFTLFLY